MASCSTTAINNPTYLSFLVHDGGFVIYDLLINPEDFLLVLNIYLYLFPYSTEIIFQKFSLDFLNAVNMLIMECGNQPRRYHTGGYLSALVIVPGRPCSPSIETE